MKKYLSRFVGGALALAAALVLVSAPLSALDVPPAKVQGKTSIQLAATMKIGINLGNSLEAAGGETAWGNPKITRQYVQKLAAAGFGAVRIPITWVKHFGPAPTFTISPDWLNRVQEVVNWVIDSGMVAIIDIHHDGAEGVRGEWLALDDKEGEVSPENDAKVLDQFSKIWKQIALYFKDYDQRLVFESMNEIHVGYGSPWEEHYVSINNLNQAFVDLVRASGGNNADRVLLVPGYNTNIGYTLAGFVAPKDPSPNRLALSVHFYDPWDFAGAGNTHVWGQGNKGADNWGQEDYVISQFKGLKDAYIDQGIAVIMGEYGAVNQAGFEKYRRYYMEFVTKAAFDKGMVPVLWENGSKNSGAESFGLFDRNTGDVLYPDILKAMMDGVNKSYKITDIPKP